MKHSNSRLSIATLALAAAFLAVGGCAAEGAGAESVPTSADAERAGGGTGGFSDTGAPPRGADAGRGDTFVPEDEEFLVREVAATDEYVFVPNSNQESSTIARIDGRDLSVVPIRVALKPVAVRAADLPNLGAVAYVLSEGKSAVSIVRAGQITNQTDPGREVSVLPVPREINSITIAPDGRHVLAYIDPDKPLPEDASVSSLQVASLVRIGDSKQKDRAVQLSVTRLIQEVEFTDDGSQAFVVGRDGINRLVLDQIDSDRFVPSLDLQLSESAFPPEDREVEVSGSGDLLVVRSSQFSGVLLHRPPPPGSGNGASGSTERVMLPEPPTDIDLHTGDGGSKTIIASLPQNSKVALVDVDAVFGGSGNAATTVLDAPGVRPGLSQITPDDKNVLLYTSRATRPDLGVLNLSNQNLRSFPLRNQIRSVAIAPTSESAVIVHEKQEGAPSDDSTLEYFQHHHGVTLFDLASGYRRPVTLNGEPASLVMTQHSDGTPFLYAMLQSADGGDRGLTRINLSSYRTDFFSLPRKPQQIGRVADKIFVSQKSKVGRITFFDIDSDTRQTVSGYELNAAID